MGQIVNKNKSFKNVFRKGYVYISFDKEDPSEYYGGTWERIKGRFLLACDEEEVGTEAGSKSVTITNANLPPHTHTFTTKETSLVGAINNMDTMQSNSITGSGIVSISNGKKRTVSRDTAASHYTKTATITATHSHTGTTDSSKIPIIVKYQYVGHGEGENECDTYEEAIASIGSPSPYLVRLVIYIGSERVSISTGYAMYYIVNDNETEGEDSENWISLNHTIDLSQGSFLHIKNASGQGSSGLLYTYHDIPINSEVCEEIDILPPCIYVYMWRKID